MWMDRSGVYTSPINSFLTYYRDKDGQPSDEFYQEIIVFTPSELRAHEERIAREIWKAARQQLEPQEDEDGAWTAEWKFEFDDYWKQRAAEGKEGGETFVE